MNYIIYREEISPEGPIWKKFDVVVHVETDDITPQGLLASLESFTRAYSRANPKYWLHKKMRITYGNASASGKWNGTTLEPLAE